MDANAPSGRCPRLLCKGMITRAPEHRESVAFFDATVWWCVETQKVTGPDDLPATPADCVAGRRCWQGGAAP